MSACVRVCMRVSACVRVCTHACMRVCMSACVRACVHACDARGPLPGPSWREEAGAVLLSVPPGDPPCRAREAWPHRRAPLSTDQGEPGARGLGKPLAWSLQTLDSGL